MDGWHGPAAWEDGPARPGPAERVAVLSDVHGNVPALDAVLAEPDVAEADLVVFNGDLLWGPEPQETWERVAALGHRAVWLRGNSERYLATGAPPAPGERETWMPGRLAPVALAATRGIPFSAVVEIAGLGPVFLCHGSPRSDHECVTHATPRERFAELAEGLTEPVLVTGHTHLRFDRTVAGRRSVNPGSVGLPFHRGEPGTACWALLGPGVMLRTTRYDVGESVARARRAGDPGAERYVATLLGPPDPERIVADAEGRVFAD
ncbi:metallophosphoesterase family protein [Actinocorallia longicatena]|uniref:Metallophosphoesterase family protein n=1 Tax=Actinocorallia longicatena TaxID=111803 RepID=A0ABP6QD79_9ACTN